MSSNKSIYALIDGQWNAEQYIVEQSSPSSESTETLQQQQIATLASSYSISLPPPNSPINTPNQQQHINTNTLTTANQWYEYYAKLYPSHSYLQRVAKLKQNEVDKQRRKQQQKLKEGGKKKGGWFSKLFWGSTSSTDEVRSPDTEEQEVETDDNSSTSSNESNTQFQSYMNDGLCGSTSPFTSSSNNDNVPKEAISFHRFHLVSESRAIQSKSHVVLPVRSAVGFNNNFDSKEGSRDVRYCIVGYGQIAEFSTLDSKSNDNERAKVTLTSDWQHVSSFIQKPQNHQQGNNDKILHDIRHCRASCIGNDLLMISWGRGDGWVVFYHRVKPKKKVTYQGNGSLEVGWEVVAVASPSQAVVRAGIKNMTRASYEQHQPTDDDESVEEKEITVEDERRLQYSGSLYVTDLLPMVIDTSTTDGKADNKPPSAVLAISRLGGYVEFIPLPNWLWQPSSNYEIPKPHNNNNNRGILNLSLIAHTTALSTRDDHLDVLALDAYHTSSKDGDEEEEVELVLVTSGRCSNTSIDGGDGKENMTFWGVTTLHNSRDMEEEGVEQDSSFDVQVQRLEQYSFTNIGSDVSLFVTDMTTDYWFVADESLSRLSKRRKVSSSPCAVMTLSAPITTLRFTPSMQHHESRVLLAALDYNGGVTAVDCTHMIHPSADSNQRISLLCSREQMMLVSSRNKSQIVNASQIEWWSDNKEDGSFTLASYATLTKKKATSRSKKGILRFQQWTGNDDSPDEIFCIPISNNALVAVFPMAVNSETLPLLQLSHSNSAHQLSMCGVQKYDDPSEIITSLLRRGDPEKALEVVHNFGNAQNFGGRVMDECHIQLWESQYDVQALKSISDDEYVIGEVMQLVKFASNDDRVSDIDLNCLTLDDLLEVYKEGLTRCTVSSEESHQLSNALRRLGTFYLLVKYYAATTKESSMNTPSLSSLYTKRFLYEFQTMSLISVATCAASKGDIDALTILLSRHPISTHERMKLLDCIPHEIDVAAYAHLLPCYSDTEESAQFLPRSGSNTRFVNTSQLFTHLIELSQHNKQHSSTEQGNISLCVAIDDADRSNVILNLEQDTSDSVMTSSKDDIASWYITRALDNTATGQVVSMRRVCEAGLIRIGFVSFANDGTYDLAANLENVDGESIVSKLVHLYYASSLFSQILIDKMKGSLSTESSLPMVVEKWNDLFTSVVRFCSMNLSESVVPFIVENSEHQCVSMFEKHVVNFVDGSECIKPRDMDSSVSSSKEEDMAIILEDNMMELCINKVKALQKDRSSNATALEDTLSMCVDFASYVDSKSTSHGRMINFVERILFTVLEVVKSGYFLPTKGVMDKLWLCFELLPSATESEDRTRVNGLFFRLVALQLCCKWLGHQTIPHDLLEALNHDSNQAKDLCSAGCRVISFICEIFCNTTARISTSDSTGQQDLLFDFVSDIDEFDKRFFSSGVQQSGRLEQNLVAPLLSQHSFFVLKHLLKLRPDWFSLESVRSTVLSFMRDCDQDNVILVCQEMLGQILFHNSIEIEYQQRERDAKQFMLQAMQLDQSLLDRLFSTTDYSTKPISLIESLLALSPQTILMGCEFWGDEMGASNACTDASLYFSSQIRLDERSAEVEANHILPPMPGALVMQLSNIIGLHKPHDLLLVKRCMVKGTLRMNLGSAAAAICYSMLCDGAFAIRDNLSWMNEQELQVLECVAAIVNSSSFHDSRIKKDLCTTALQLFSYTDVPVYKMIVDKLKQLEYELLSMSDAIEQVPSNNLYCRSLIAIFSYIKQSSRDDLLHKLSLTGKVKTTEEPEKLSDMGKLLLQWAANEALKARDTSTSLCTSAAAAILMVTELGSRCLSEFKDPEAISSIMNEILEDYSTSSQASKAASIPNDSITPELSLCQRLSDRGYGRNAARRAVIMTNNKGYSEALTWAIAHFQDDDFDSPIYYLQSDGSVHANRYLIDMTGELLRLVNDKCNSPKASVKPKQIVHTKKQFVSKIPSPPTSRATREASMTKKPSFVSKIPSPFTSTMKSKGELPASRLQHSPTPPSNTNSEDSIEGSLGSRSSIKKQVRRGRANLGTKQLTTEERKKLAIEGRRLLEAARAKRKKVVGPPSSITTNNTKP